MSYCPEDGVKMLTLKDSYYPIYKCPICDSIWEYNGEDGTYTVITKEDADHINKNEDSVRR